MGLKTFCCIKRDVNISLLAMCQLSADANTKEGWNGVEYSARKEGKRSDFLFSGSSCSHCVNIYRVYAF